MVSPQPFARLVAAEIDGRAHNIRYRQSQFHRLQSALVQHIDQIRNALQTDSSNAPEEIQAEICLALKEIRTHYLSLNMQEDLENEYRVTRGKDNQDATRGSGIVYIIPATHTMFFSVVSALSAAIAAGNCVILELTKNTMALPPLLREILLQVLDADTFAISEERPDATFLEKTLVVAQTSTASLSGRGLVSPVTARTIAVVDRTTDIQGAARSLVAARFAFGGRSTYSPDVVLVQEFAMKTFVEAIIHQSSKYLAGPAGEERQKVLNPRRSSPGLSFLDLAHKDPSARVLVSGSGWGVVEVHDRNSQLLQKKVEEKVLVLHPVTSLDDAIDLSAQFGTLAATYAFAEPASSKYLTQFIDAHVSYINQVPADLLIGPASPTNVPHSRETRYATATFQVPRPQFITQSTNTALIRHVLDKPSSQEALAAWKEAVAPLPATGQKLNSRIGFFEQGIITGGVITLFSFVATVSTLGYYGFVFVRGLRRG
ncbi:Aldehyde/histidinol dehydrogenase [Aspergillus pseudodeflectus]|uniref:Aldehyde/histidinol dehydrogenase n=1 Tax=Aspergillus pseudodeflectus TaxID=176178 RepID=A0ABR4K4T1_9EURO